MTDWLAPIDWMARGGGIAILMLWSWLLIRDHRGSTASRLAVVLCGTIICYLLVTADWPGGYGGANGVAGVVLAVGAGSTSGVFWLFARTWFGDRSRVEPWAAALVVLAAINVAVLQLTYADPGPLFYASLGLFRVGMFAFAAAGMWAAWRGREGDLIEPRRRLRLSLVLGVGVYVVLVNIVEIAVRGSAAPKIADALVETGSFVLIFGFCAVMFAHRQADLFAASRVPQTSPQSPSAGDTALAERIQTHMVETLAWRDEGLTIAALAAQLGEQEYRLRRTINGRLGHRNFPAFLNSFRLAEVKAALADPAQRDVPILTIALDAGFGSLGPFNRAFRDVEGTTPSAWRTARLADSGIG